MRTWRRDWCVYADLARSLILKSLLGVAYEHAHAVMDYCSDAGLTVQRPPLNGGKPDIGSSAAWSVSRLALACLGQPCGNWITPFTIPPSTRARTPTLPTGLSPSIQSPSLMPKRAASSAWISPKGPGEITLSLATS